MPHTHPASTVAGANTPDASPTDRDAARDAVRPSSAPKSVAPLTGRHGQARVLVVDDEPTLKALIARTLEVVGCRCETAGDGVEALAKIDAAHYDLLVTDLRMPRMGGVELIEHVRERGIETPVVIMSGYTDFDFARQALRLRVSDYLVKPIADLTEVQAAARRAIETYSKQCARAPSPANILGAVHAAGSAEATDLRGHTLGGFEIRERIGRGGMGSVYKAVQLSTNRPVAFKALQLSKVDDREAALRFVREAQVAAQLDHPNIVRGLGAGVDAGYCYFAMEFVDGRSAAEHLNTNGPFGEKSAICVASQILVALEYAWSLGLVHRDVAPGNILLTSDGRSRLADLGIVRDRRPGSPALTAEGVTYGTPFYMAPEQARAFGSADFRADVYGLGATLYHMVAGAPPFDSQSALDVITMHLRDRPKPAFEKNAEVSLELSSVLDKMLHKSPDGRYQKADQLLEDFTLALQGRAPRHAALIS